MILKLYLFFGRLIRPYLEGPWIQKRLKAGKEDPKRYKEKFGFYGDREGFSLQPVWFHGASVGESLALLPLIYEFHKRFPALPLLVTTSTTTSRDLMEKRLPPGIQHVFAPFDSGAYVNRFLDHWSPRQAIFIESEIWPRTLMALKEREIPAYLVSARLSPKSLQLWGYFPGTFKYLASLYTGISPQSHEQKLGFESLGLKGLTAYGNLKFASLPLGWAEEELEHLKPALEGRPVWCAASTHDGEEEMVIASHQALQVQFPNLLTIIVPRHPLRGQDILTIIPPHISVALRSLQNPLTPSTEIYVADTLGELGLFFAMSPVVFLGGSLIPIGGHNLLEPAHTGAAILHGPHMHKTRDLEELFKTYKGARVVKDRYDLTDTLEDLFSNPQKITLLGKRAKSIVERESKVLEDLMAVLTEDLR